MQQNYSSHINYSGQDSCFYIKNTLNSHHLGNVLATVLDRKTGAGSTSGGTLYDHWSADLASTADYYPGGMMMPGRNTEYSWSRMGSQSQQKDDEVYGKGNTYAFKYRMEDARINRFFSVDPLHSKYPHNSDYAFSENKIVASRELEGLEAIDFLCLGNHTDENFKKVTSAQVFKLAFSEDLPKKMIDHYAFGGGKPMVLNEREMAGLNVFHVSLVGTTDRDMAKFDKIKTKAKPGDIIKLSNYTLDAAVGQAGTLGRFTIELNGTLTFDRNNKNKWTFVGQMRYTDVYDFQRDSKTDEGGYPSNSWSDKQVEFASYFLMGMGYRVESKWVPVKQNSSTDETLDYFKDKSEEVKSSRVTKERSNE